MDEGINEVKKFRIEIIKKHFLLLVVMGLVLSVFIMSVLNCRVMIWIFNNNRSSRG